MPENETIERAEQDKGEGKAPSAQAGEFVREEMHHIREESTAHGPPNRRSHRIVEGAACGREAARSRGGNNFSANSKEGATRRPERTVLAQAKTLRHAFSRNLARS